MYKVLQFWTRDYFVSSLVCERNSKLDCSLGTRLVGLSRGSSLLVTVLLGITRYYAVYLISTMNPE